MQYVIYFFSMCFLILCAKGIAPHRITVEIVKPTSSDLSKYIRGSGIIISEDEVQITSIDKKVYYSLIENPSQIRKWKHSYQFPIQSSLPWHSLFSPKSLSPEDAARTFVAFTVSFWASQAMPLPVLPVGFEKSTLENAFIPTLGGLWKKQSLSEILNSQLNKQENVSNNKNDNNSNRKKSFLRSAVKLLLKKSCLSHNQTASFIMRQFWMGQFLQYENILELKWYFHTQTNLAMMSPGFIGNSTHFEEEGMPWKKFNGDFFGLSRQEWSSISLQTLKEVQLGLKSLSFNGMLNFADFQQYPSSFIDKAEELFVILEQKVKSFESDQLKRFFLED